MNGGELKLFCPHSTEPSSGIRLHVIVWEFPGVSIDWPGQFYRFLVAYNFLGLWIEANRSSKLVREVGQRDCQIHLVVIVDIATWLLAGLDTIQPLAFMSRRRGNGFAGT